MRAYFLTLVTVIPIASVVATAEVLETSERAEFCNFTSLITGTIASFAWVALIYLLPSDATDFLKDKNAPFSKRAEVRAKLNNFASCCAIAAVAAQTIAVRLNS